MSMEISWLKDCQFDIVTENGFKISADAENKAAPCPTEILLSALGSCSATDVVLELQKQGVDLEKLSIKISYTLTEQSPRLYETVNLHLMVKSKLVTKLQIKTAAQNAINKYSHVCLMLQPKIDITYSVEIFAS